MKKLVILISLVFLSIQVGSAAWFTLGLNAGYRYLDDLALGEIYGCLLYTSPSPRDRS